LGYKEKEFAKIKISFVPDAYYHTKTLPIEDGISNSGIRSNVIEEIFYERLSDKLGREFIGLDHPDRSPGRKLGFGEKALSIKS